jgi:hypothetical protein
MELKNSAVEEALKSVESYALNNAVVKIQRDQPNLFKRLNKWCKFFNDNLHQPPCLHVATIRAIVECAIENDFFKTQTEEEFRLSLGFYQRLFDTKLPIIVQENEAAKTLLITSLIYGKFPGLVLRPIKLGLPNDGHYFHNQDAKILFEHLFVKHEIPKVFLNHLSMLSATELNALMWVVQGNSLRTFSQLPISMSRKETHYLKHFEVETIDFEGDVLKRTIILCKLLRRSEVQMNPTDFLFMSNVFRHQLNRFIHDLDFWMSAFVFFELNNWHNFIFGPQEVIDYFEYQKYTKNPNYSLKGRTGKSVGVAIYRWHREAEFRELEHYKTYSWSGDGIESTVIRKGVQRYRFAEITSGDRLYFESKKLSHCVFSYVDRCISNHCRIWSMENLKDGFYEPLITIEIRQGRIVQTQGQYNRMPTKQEYKLIIKWAKKAGYNFMHCVFSMGSGKVSKQV